MNMPSSASSGDGAPASDPLKGLYDRRQPHITGMLFMALGAVLALGYGTSATASAWRALYILGLAATAVAFAVAGYLVKRDPGHTERNSRGSRGPMIAASGATVYLLSASDMVVATVSALAVPCFAWVFGRVWRDAARLSREIAEHTESGPTG